MSEYRERLARDMAIVKMMLNSCESCERREVDLFVHGTFVCWPCAEAAPCE